MEFNFTFNEQEANIILQALGELPFKTVAPIITKIQTQAREQINVQDNTKEDQIPIGGTD